MVTTRTRNYRKESFKGKETPVQHGNHQKSLPSLDLPLSPVHKLCSLTAGQSTRRKLQNCTRRTIFQSFCWIDVPKHICILFSSMSIFIWTLGLIFRKLFLVTFFCFSNRCYLNKLIGSMKSSIQRSKEYQQFLYTTCINLSQFSFFFTTKQYLNGE